MIYGRARVLFTAAANREASSKLTLINGESKKLLFETSINYAYARSEPVSKRALNNNNKVADFVLTLLTAAFNLCSLSLSLSLSRVDYSGIIYLFVLIETFEDEEIPRRIELNASFEDC